MQKIKHYIYQFFSNALPEILYMVTIPFYMIMISYLVMFTNSTDENLWYMRPLFLGTVWIPALLSFSLNFLLKKIFQSGTRKWVRNYPIVFILFYTIYFFILSKLEFGKSCLTSAVAGGVLIVFLCLLKVAQKQMYYLPPPKEFWFYVLTFLPPIVILFFTDVYFLIVKESRYFILMAPVSYLPEILGFFTYATIRSFIISKNKHPMTLFEAIFVMQIVNVAMAFYFGSYWGDKIIWMALTISFATIWLAERFSKYKALS